MSKPPPAELELCLGVVWRDGDPPHFLLGEGATAAPSGLPYPPVSPPRRERAATLHVCSRDLARLEAVELLRWLARVHATELHVALHLDSGCDWEPASLAHAGEVILQIRRALPALFVGFVLQTDKHDALRAAPLDLLLGANIAPIVCFTARSVELDRQAMDALGALADDGYAAEAKLYVRDCDCLDDVLSAVDAWQAITRHGLSAIYFALPSDHCGAVAGVLYDRRAVDLWRTRPFSDILSILSNGTASHVVGDDELVCIVGGSPRRPAARFDSCACPITRSLAGACDYDWGTDDLELILRAARDIATAILPRIGDDIARAARYRATHLRTAESERTRVAIRDGRPVFWKDNVRLTHQPQAGVDDGRRHDLSQFRQRDGASDAVLPRSPAPLA